MFQYPAEIANRLDQIIAAFETPTLCLTQRLLEHHGADKAAFRLIGTDARTLTYGQLLERSGCFAAGLARHGVGPGDRVAVLMGKSADYLTALLAIWRLGAVVVPLFTAFAPPAIAYRLRASQAKATICDGAQAAKLDDAALSGAGPLPVIVSGGEGGSHVPFEDLVLTGIAAPAPASLPVTAPFVRIFTSGTTGQPKGVDLPLRALASLQAYAEFGLGIEPGDVYWCAADPGWAYGLYYAVLAPLLLGQCAILLEGGFDARRTLDVLENEKVTNYAAAPTVYRALKAEPRREGLALKKASSAGEPLTPDINQWAPAALGVTVHDHYGQTETGMLVNNHQHPLLQTGLRPGSMGIAMPGWGPVVLNSDSDEPAPAGSIGRLAMPLADSPLAWFDGYADDLEKSREKFSRDGKYYLTGDAARMDVDGHIHFYARDDDLILMAGYRISPLEVEAVLNKHPAVIASAVFGVPDALRGERLEACVVLSPGQAGIEIGEALKKWVKDHYARHAFPHVIHCVPALPTTPSGKIKRKELKAQRTAEIAAQYEVPTASRDRAI